MDTLYGKMTFIDCKPVDVETKHHTLCRSVLHRVKSDGCLINLINHYCTHHIPCSFSMSFDAAKDSLPLELVINIEFLMLQTSIVFPNFLLFNLYRLFVPGIILHKCFGTSTHTSKLNKISNISFAILFSHVTFFPESTPGSKFYSVLCNFLFIETDEFTGIATYLIIF